MATTAWNDLSVFFRSRGWKEHPPAAGGAALFSKRLTNVPDCLTNHRTSLHATVWNIDLGGGHKPIRTVSFDITGEYAPDRWAELKVYTIRWDEVEAAIDEVEAALVRAWQAIYVGIV